MLISRNIYVILNTHYYGNHTLLRLQSGLVFGSKKDAESFLGSIDQDDDKTSRVVKFSDLKPYLQKDLLMDLVSF
jgi:hypothetical protein